MVGNGFWKQGRYVAVFAHAEKNPVQPRRFSFLGRGNLQQFPRSCGCGPRGFVFALDAMDVGRRDLQRLEKQFAGDSIIAVGVIWRDAAFVCPEKMRVVDAFVILGATRYLLEKVIRNSPARKRHREWPLGPSNS